MVLAFWDRLVVFDTTVNKAKNYLAHLLRESPDPRTIDLTWTGRVVLACAVFHYGCNPLSRTGLFVFECQGL
jgi:hypothetical protein